MATKEASRTKSSKPLKRQIRSSPAAKKGSENKGNTPDKKAEIKQTRKKLRAIDHKYNTPDSTQKTIPYLEMYKDGICHVEDDYYTITICFSDINYELARDEEKNVIFQKYCEFHNYFDDSVTVQFTFMNLSDSTSYSDAIHIDERNDNFNDIRREFADMLKNQLEKGNNGLLRIKYLTVGVHENDRKTAKNRLEHLEMEIIENFKEMGVQAYGLDGYERLQVLHRAFNPDSSDKFLFDWKYAIQTGRTTKDAIAPPSFVFNSGDGGKNIFRMGDVYGQTLYMDIMSMEVSDRMLTEFLNLDNNIFFNIHLRSWDQTAAIKHIKKKLSELNQMKIKQQTKASEKGYDMDSLSPELRLNIEELERLFKDLSARNERLFLSTFTITCFAKSKKKLDLLVRQLKSLTQEHNCRLIPLDWVQEDALMSSIPLGLNKIEIESRDLTTSAAAVFIPFTTRELFQQGKALYYGLNALSNNLIMADRKLLKNPNGLFLGSPGSGKSFAAKREMTNAFLITDDDIIICDPEGEYYPLVNELGGQVIKISPTSPYHVNPMDISLNYSEDDDPITLKSDFILSLCELVVGGKYGLTPEERSIIDRCTRQVYTKYFKDPVPENMPVLEDLYNLLCGYAETNEAAQHVTASLELYVTGSQNLFNHKTNVDISNRLVCFDIKEIGKSLRKLGMLIIQDQVWNRVSENREEGRSTWYYMDEFHLLLKEEQTASYSVEIWKRFRKWGGIPTGITQNVKDLLASKEVENILDNSEFICMLNQMSGDREILAEKLGISEYQLSHVTNSAQGKGLLFYGDVILPFIDNFPKDTKLYRLMTTKPQEQS